ncbi:hypothetical protein SUDANB146_03828 [Streptomyces sp. enrichment culture]
MPLLCGGNVGSWTSSCVAPWGRVRGRCARHGVRWAGGPCGRVAAPGRAGRISVLRPGRRPSAGGAGRRDGRGRGESGGRHRLLPRPPEIRRRRPGGPEPGEGCDDQPGPAVSDLGGAVLRTGPAQACLNRRKVCSMPKRRRDARHGRSTPAVAVPAPGHHSHTGSGVAPLGRCPARGRITVPPITGRAPGSAVQAERWVSRGWSRSQARAVAVPWRRAAVTVCVPEVPRVSGSPKTDSPPCRGGRPLTPGSRGGTARHGSLWDNDPELRPRRVRAAHRVRHVPVLLNAFRRCGARPGGGIGRWAGGSRSPS